MINHFWWAVQTSAGSPAVLGHNLVSNTELASVLFSQFGFSAKAGVVYDWSTNWPRIIDVFPGLEAFCEPRGNFIAYALQVCMGDVCKDTNGLSRYLSACSMRCSCASILAFPAP